MATSSSDSTSHASGSPEPGLYPQRALRQLVQGIRRSDPDAIRRARAVFADLREVPDATVAELCGHQRCQHIIAVERGAPDWAHLQETTPAVQDRVSTTPHVAWASYISRGQAPGQWGAIGSSRQAPYLGADRDSTSDIVAREAVESNFAHSVVGNGFWGPVGLNVDAPAVSLVVGSPGSGVSYACFAITQAYQAPIPVGGRAPRPAAALWIVTGQADRRLNVPPEMRIARIRTTPGRLAMRRAQYPDVPIDLLGWAPDEHPSETRWRLEGFARACELDATMLRISAQPAETWRTAVATYHEHEDRDDAASVLAILEERAARIGRSAMPPPPVAGITVVDAGEDDPVLAAAANNCHEFAADVLLAHLTARRDPWTEPPLTIVIPDAGAIIADFGPIQHLMREIRALRHHGISLVLGYQDEDIEPPRPIAEIAGYRFLHQVPDDEARARLRPLLGLPDAITDDIWTGLQPGTAIAQVVGDPKPFLLAWLPPSALDLNQALLDPASIASRPR